MSAFALAAPAALEYQRAAVLHGELWRLLTCHWVHWSPEHLQWDLVASLGLVVACRAHLRQAAAALAASSLAIPLAILVLQPRLATYRGLSGLESALFVQAAVAILLASRVTNRADATSSARLRAAVPRLAACAALGGFTVKMLWEATTGGGLFVDTAAAGFQPVPLAHFVGGLCGAAALCWVKRRSAGPPVARSSETFGPRRQ